MKRLFGIILMVLAMVLSTINTFAQTATLQQRLTREQLAEKQAQHIVHDLALDDKTAQKFTTTWLEYQGELWALGPRVEHNRMNKTDAEAENAIKQRMERSQKILDLREKYYKKYSQFLTQQQILRVYELEHKMMQRLGKKTMHKRKAK